MAIHSQATGVELHPIGPFATYANAAARTGATVASGDVGKVAFQTDTGMYWLLLTTGPTWAPVTVVANADGSITIAADGTIQAKQPTRHVVIADVAASPQSFTVPTGVTLIEVEMIRPGAGGGSGGASSGGASSGATEGGGGGGSGGATGGSATSEYLGFITVTPGHTITLNPGAGGTAGNGGVAAAAGANGNPGSTGGTGGASTIVDTTASSTLFTTLAGGVAGNGGAAGTAGSAGAAGNGGALRSGGTQWGLHVGTAASNVAGGAGGTITG